MSLPIISADQRLKEKKGIKLLLLGPSGVGKTTLLLTLDPETTLFMDLEPVTWRYRTGPAIPCDLAPGRSFVTSPSFWGDRTRPCGMTSHFHRPIIRRCVSSTVTRRRWLPTRPILSTPLRYWAGSVLSGVKASPSPSRRKPVSRIFAAPMVCMARR